MSARKPLPEQLGRYHILSQLGEGGTTTRYCAGEGKCISSHCAWRGPPNCFGLILFRAFVFPHDRGSHCGLATGRP